MTRHNHCVSGVEVASGVTRYRVPPVGVLAIGEDGLADDGRGIPFLEVYTDGGLVWIENASDDQLVSVTDASGYAHARLDPGMRLPVVFEQLHVIFGNDAARMITVHSTQPYFESGAPVV